MRWLLRTFLTAAALASSVSAAFAQPALSRGEQTLATSYTDCMGRAQRAFQGLGWVNIGSGGAYVNAFKGAAGSYITCNEATPGRMIVNVFVASNGNPDAGAEREALQRAMGAAVTRRCEPPARGVFIWEDNGRRLGEITFFENGKAVIDWFAQYRDQQWGIEGDGALVVATSNNDYVTRLTCDTQAGIYRGARHNASRTKDGTVSVMRFVRRF